MSDDYKRGLVTGLAMQPLYVSEPSSTEAAENFCEQTVIGDGIMSDDCYCRYIEFEED